MLLLSYHRLHHVGIPSVAQDVPFLSPNTHTHTQPRLFRLSALDNGEARDTESMGCTDGTAWATEKSVCAMHRVTMRSQGYKHKDPGELGLCKLIQTWDSLGQ